MKKITIQVEFTAEVPDDLDEDEIDLISLDMDVDLIRVDGSAGPLEGAVVTGYGTTSIFQD